MGLMVRAHTYKVLTLVKPIEFPLSENRPWLGLGTKVIRHLSPCCLFSGSIKKFPSLGHCFLKNLFHEEDNF